MLGRTAPRPAKAVHFVNTHLPGFFQHELGSARLWPNKEHRYMRLVENTKCHAAQHELLQPGITMGSNDDEIHSLFLSVLGDCVGGAVTLQ